MSLSGVLRKLFAPRTPLPTDRNSCDICDADLDGAMAVYDSYWDDLTCDNDQCVLEARALRV